MIIITADDFGKDVRTTDNILLCVSQNRISCASAMVFMEDSERAASLSVDAEVEIGLHLNFTASFTGKNCSSVVRKSQRRVLDYLKVSSICSLVYNPFLSGDFKTVFNAQLDEFVRTYKKDPPFYNGHHHMHLCTNVLLSMLLPKRSIVRRTYTFTTGEKNILNMQYRRLLNWWIDRRYYSSDKFLSIEPINDLERLKKIFATSNKEHIEIEVHPEKEEERRFLCSETFKDLLTITHLGNFSNLHTIG